MAHAAPASAATATATFTYTGAEQAFTAQGGVSSVHVLAVGATGGAGSGGTHGGAGAEVAGELHVTPGEVLFVEVGRPGEHSGNGAGGGASDVRTESMTSALSLGSRLLVAGGGGGGGDQLEPGIAGSGGAAGEAGEDSSNELKLPARDEGTGGAAGTDIAGGAAGALSGDLGNCIPGTAGQLGSGGEGSSCGHSRGAFATGDGGGGGGGYYGGGGGGGVGSIFAGRGAGGGGGSSLAPAGGSVALAPAGTEPRVQITYVKLPVPGQISAATSAVTRRSVRVTATMSTEGSRLAACRVEYGLTRSYRASAPCRMTSTGTEAASVSAKLGELAPGSTYHFRIVATNSTGAGYSADATFQTIPRRPEITSESARAITQQDAVLAGSVDPEHGTLTGCRVEYGTSIPYRSSAPCTLAPESGPGPFAASLAIDTLSASTTYHYRIVASNAGGTRRGADETFRTPRVPDAAYAYTGNEQLYTVPPRVVAIRVLAVGGQGGHATVGKAPGGLGAQVSGELAVTPGETLYVEVAGDGAVNFGGFGGGGESGGDSREAGGGGGASDVRTSPLAVGLQPDDRLIVAAGGGGAGWQDGAEETGGGGGAAGEPGAEGYDSFGPFDAPNVVTGGGGATQSGGGEGGSDQRVPRPSRGGGGGAGQNGSLGTGGEGGPSNGPGGGGGGGYYGGGGGGGSVFGGGGGGGGGSSLVPAGATVEVGSPFTQPQVQIFVTRREG
jgi:hypothetical protein